jgi:serine/threonine-protein kinase
MNDVAPKVRVRQFGRYVLGRRIGSGGMATVFAARQVGVRGATRVVAVKVMATALADDPAARRMFEREAVIATRVEHPNIVRTYEVGEVRGEIFLAMELVQGAALSTLCSRAPGAVPVPIAVRIACDVARGLSAVHDLRDAGGELLGVVHQDVTPHNVVVGYDGTTKLLDFGVARMVSLDGTRTETIRGKPAYLAPEQKVLGRIDARADIYGLGAVLFELLTGARSSLGASEQRGPVDVRTLRADVPEAIARVVSKALALVPADRFATAEEMRLALTEARDEAGLARVDETDVGPWARAVAPPAWSVAELERDLLDESYHAELAAVADLPTMHEGPDSQRARTGDRERLAHRRGVGTVVRVVAVLSGAAVTFGLAAWGYAKHTFAPGLKLASSTAGQAPAAAGVHLFLTLEGPDSSAWSGVAFDHITVTATSGAEIVVVCLTPRAEGQRAFAVPSPAPSDPDPCADLHAGGFAGVNGVYPPSTFNDDWDLTTNPWELDFDGIAPGAPVVVLAKAVFGGASAAGAPLGTMTARGQAIASTSFPNVVLAFATPPLDSFWGEGAARCGQGAEIGSWLDVSTFPSEPSNAVACPRASKGLAFTQEIRSAATPKLGTVGRIPPVAVSGCPGGEPDGVVVWKSDPVPLDAGCVSLMLTGRFAQCAANAPDAASDPSDAGSCATSVRCTPPPTDLVALSDDGRVLGVENISCVPSYPEPVQYKMTVRDTDAGEVALALRRGASDGGCFFDLYDFTSQPGCGP